MKNDGAEFGIKEVESKRKSLSRLLISYGVLMVFVYLPLILYLVDRFNLPRKAGRFLGLPLFYLAYMYYEKKRLAYSTSYYNHITTDIISDLRPEWRHMAEEGIESETIKKSHLIEKSSTIETNNLIGGIVKDIRFRFCQVRTTQNRFWALKLPKVAFQGYFFEFDFPKFTKEPIHIHPTVFKDFGELKGLPSCQKSDAKEFDKVFAIYCDDPEQMRYVLTLSLMDKMLNLEETIPGKVSFYFNEGTVQIAMLLKGKTIEPQIMSAPEMNEVYEIHSEILNMVDHFVDELRLQIDIWKKEGKS